MPKVFEDGVNTAGVGEDIQTAEIDDNAITLGKLAHQSNSTLLRMSGSGVPEAGLLINANITDDIIALTKIVVGSKGEIISSDGVTRQLLAVGTNAQVLTADSGETTGMKWATPSSGGTDLTTKGDVHGYDTVQKRIPVGTNDQVLTADSAQALGLKWATPTSAVGTDLTTKGDIHGYSTVQARLPVGADGEVLESRSSETLGLKWIAGGGKLRIIGSIRGNISRSITYFYTINRIKSK